MKKGTLRLYAVMNSEKTAITITDENFEVCKKYCRPGYLIAEWLPYRCGFLFSLKWYKYYKPLSFRYHEKNILWLHWTLDWNILHKAGKTVWINVQFSNN